jgi:4-alpha-glucanotransferase
MRTRAVCASSATSIFIAHQSADVWAQRELFELDADGRPTVVAGVPPDLFSATGQRWGNLLIAGRPMHATTTRGGSSACGTP